MKYDYFFYFFSNNGFNRRIFFPLRQLRARRVLNAGQICSFENQRALSLYKVYDDIVSFWFRTSLFVCLYLFRFKVKYTIQNTEQR